MTGRSLCSQHPAVCTARKHAFVPGRYGVVAVLVAVHSVHQRPEGVRRKRLMTR